MDVGTSPRQYLVGDYRQVVVLSRQTSRSLLEGTILEFAAAMLFDPYVPTRTQHAIEVRVRTARSAPAVLRLNETDHALLERGHERERAPGRDGKQERNREPEQAGEGGRGPRQVREVELVEPHVSHRGQHYFRHTFGNLPSDTQWSLSVQQGPEHATLTVSTLPSPPGREKLRVGLLADLHLSQEQTSIDAYGSTTKRLYGLSRELAGKYLQRLADLGADVIVLLGDVVDPCTPQTLSNLRALLESSRVPVYPIIGNHEPWSPDGESRFYRALDLPVGGYCAVRRNGVRLVLLSTPSPDAVGPRSAQRRWLESELASAAPGEDVVLFSHFSLLLHPCVQGSNDDGYQLLDSHRELLGLLRSFPQVRAFVAGHKNVPSLVVANGIAHTLSPQLIQAPCGYDLLHLFAGGLGRTTYEIDEQHYVEVARAAYGGRFAERYGTDAARNFVRVYPSR